MNKYQLLMQERQIKQTAGLFVGVVAGLMAAGFMWYVIDRLLAPRYGYRPIRRQLFTSGLEYNYPE